MVRWIQVLLPLILLVSCSARIWNYDSLTLRSLFEKGDYSALKDLDFKKLDPKEVQSLGPGSYWGMMKILTSLGRLEDALIFADLEIKGAQEPWASESAQWKTQRLLNDEDYPMAEKAAKEWINLKPTDVLAQRSLFTSLYWQKKDLQAQELLKTWVPGSFSEDMERENQLYHIVLALRLNQTLPKASITKLLYDQEASALHNRLYSFFEEDPKRYRYLSPWETAVLKFKSNLAGSRLAPALDVIKKYLPEKKLWDNSGLIKDLEFLNRGPGQALVGIKQFLLLESTISEKNQFTFYFRLGRLQKQAFQWASAASSFRKALTMAKTPDEIQRTQWNLINCDFEFDLGALERDLAAMGPWSDPYYFSDVIDDQFSLLIMGKKWDSLSRWARMLGDRPAPEDRAMIYNTLGRIWALHPGLKAPEWKLKSQDLWKMARDLAPWEYEGLMARYYLKESFDLKALSSDAVPLENQNPKSPGTYIENLQRFGLTDDLGATVLKDFDTFELDTVREIVRTMQGKMAYLPSLKIMYKVFRKKDFRPTLVDWQLLYPKAFEDLVIKVSTIEKVDPWVFYGLVREESHFDAKIKSWVGAVGLSQLMPTTAAEVALRMKMKDPDLTDPLTNLTLGARYFSNRITTFENVSHGMMAYNAGAGRVKGWKNTFKDFPDDLFVEAVPFDETKNYVKKILRSSLFYSLLYSGRSHAEIVSMVYPGLKP